MAWPSHVSLAPFCTPVPLLVFAPVSMSFHFTIETRPFLSLGLLHMRFLWTGMLFPQLLKKYHSSGLNSNVSLSKSLPWSTSLQFSNIYFSSKELTTLCTHIFMYVIICSCLSPHSTGAGTTSKPFFTVCLVPCTVPETQKTLTE